MRLRASLRAVPIGAALLIACLWCGAGASGDMRLRTSPKEPEFAAGQIIVKVAQGVTEEGASSVFAAHGCKMLESSELPRYYLVELTAPEGSVSDAVDMLSSDPKVELAEPNYKLYPFEIPNDPRYTDQWGMEQMSMPDAWDGETGEAGIVIAIIDTGVKTDHEDLVNKLLPGTNTGGGDANDVTDVDGHGSHCSGIAAAETDNGLGVAGTAWECKILPVKAGDYFFWTWDIVEAINWAADRADVISMSLGGYYADPFEHEAIQSAVRKGVVVLAASGNDSDRDEGYVAPVGYPAAFPECIAVGASGPDGLVTVYSNGGEDLDLVAPGGEGRPTDENDIEELQKEIISCGIAETDSYAWGQGTSMACPHAAGCAALLLSFGISSSDVRQFLQDSAVQPEGGSGHNDDYGYGIINMANALGAFGFGLSIETPLAGSVIEYQRPKVIVDFRNANPATILLSIDGTDLVSPDLGNVSDYYDPATEMLECIPPLLSSGSHQLQVSAEDTGGARHKSDDADFLIVPHMQAGGLTFWALPYDIADESGGPEVVLAGQTWSLARYDPVNQRYHVYNPFAQPQELGASLDPPDSGVRPADAPAETETPPRGLGYWLRLPPGQKVEMAVAASESPTSNYEMDLVTGWNMIGNPFPHYVDWNSVRVRHRGREVTLQQAVDEEWVGPAIYRYVRPTTQNPEGYYTWDAAPMGKFRPWEAHWVKVEANTSDKQTWDPDVYGTSMDPRAYPVTLVVPAAEAGARSLEGEGDPPDDPNPNAGSACKRDEFRLRLSVGCGGAQDLYNFAGVSPDATDGFDRNDVLEPPAAPSGFVSLAFGAEGHSRSAGLAQDLRSEVGPGKKWTFTVVTDQDGEPVEITWPEIRKMPNCYDYVVRDLDAEKSVALRSATRYRFMSPSGSAKRRFELEIKPASLAALMVTGVAVGQGRAGSAYSISFNLSDDAEVSLRVLSLSGKTLRTIPAGLRSAGISTVVWDRRDNTGRKAPRGAYICEVRATDTERRSVRAVAPFFVR